MSEPPSDEESTGQTVRRKARQIERDRRKKPVFWQHLAHVGVLGWVFMLPVVTLAWVGHLAADATGELWPALVGLAAGLLLGGYLVWRNLRDSLR
ncbi:MAG TPA: hypothetical protein RMH99_06235 [Sandaracinaceae bacterium LLY-WYZ-13_1]|nr:hypothetical protein [Sandaracinaceae bacterium LLY-WYZ-13_1]